MQRGQSIARAVAAAVLAAHVAAGITVLLLLPHGFAPTNVHLWSNTVVPAVSVLATTFALVRHLFFRSASGVSVLVAAAAGGWLAAALAGAHLFPTSISMARWGPPAAVALVLIALAWWAKERTAATAFAFAVGAALGALEIFAQRAPLPSTRPAGGTLAEVRGEPSSEEAGAGQVVFPCGKGKIRINPLLSFQSRSPDATWVLLAPEEQLGRRRTLAHYAKTPNGFRAAYTDDGETTLVATRDKNGLGLDLEAITKLPSPIYSHLNTWTTIHVAFETSLAFGPTGATRFPVEPSDYPSGRPAQLAYLAEDLTFRVVRAYDAEKGPFSELASGHLGRDEPLTLEIRPRDEKDKGCRLVFKDWSAQVSTDASPTAGWGVAQNSVQFFARDGEALILLALAETGPGRGFDTVGHAAGTYRNRARIEQIR